MTSEALWQRPRTHESTPALRARSVATFLIIPFAIFYGPSLAWTVAAVACLVLMPVALLSLTHKAETARVAKLHMWYGLAIAVIAAASVPAMWTGMCVMAASTVTAGVFGSRERSGLFYGSAGAAALVAVGWLHGVENWFGLSFVLLLIAPVAISSRKVLQALLGHEAEALQALTSGAQAIIWEADAETGAMLTVAGSVGPLTGFGPREWAKLPFSEVVHPEDVEGFRDLDRLCADAINDGTAKYDWEGRIRTRSGGWQSVRESLQLEKGIDGNPVVRGLTHDIGEIVAANRLAAHRANYDELTELPNRSRMFAIAEEAIDGESLDSIALLHIDIDRFTEVNRTLGHAVGDDYLRTIANRLRNLCDSQSTLARIGGDEFGILIKGCDEQRAIAFAEETIATCSEELVLSGLSLRLGASVGIAVTDDSKSYVTLFRQADSAMHEAKKKRGTWHLARKEDLESARDRLRLAGQVAVAIEQHQLELFFQPKLRLSTKQVIGFEGLIRWRHPEEGLLLPFKFLDLIDLSGQFDAFNRLVVQSAIEFCAQAQHRGHRIKVALNLSGNALQDLEIVDTIASATAIWQVDPSLLVIEVTEDAIGDDLSSVKPALNQLAALGCGISIDDFGTGDSSLVRLRDLPVTEVKIDRSFVADLNQDNNSAIIVRSILDLASMLGLTCVAEGIEDLETAQRLVDYGCAEGQGYLYSRPVPAAEALDYMVQQNASFTS